MTQGEPAAARIPASEYEKLEKVVTSETGELWKNKAEFIEPAMWMFIDEDEQRAEVERLIEIDDMLARMIDDYSRRRTSADVGITVIPSEWSDEPTKRLNERIDPDLKERFKTWTAENTDLTYGQAVARALREYRQDSWKQRIEALTEHIHAQLTALNTSIPVTLDIGGVDEAREEKDPYHQEEKIEAIRDDILDCWPEPVEEIEEIGGMIPEAWFAESIDRWCTKGNREQATDKTRRKYLDLVVDEFGLGRSGANFVVGDVDGLAFERKDYENLTTEERVEAVRVELLRQTTSRGAAQVSAADIQSEFFDGEPSDSVAHDLRKRAAEADGFGERKARGGEKTVYVHPPEVTDETLREAANLPDRDALSSEVTDEMNALMDATIATDGGTDRP